MSRSSSLILARDVSFWSSVGSRRSLVLPSRSDAPIAGSVYGWMMLLVVFGLQFCGCSLSLPLSCSFSTASEPVCLLAHAFAPAFSESNVSHGVGGFLGTLIIISSGETISTMVASNHWFTVSRQSIHCPRYHFRLKFSGDGFGFGLLLLLLLLL